MKIRKATVEDVVRMAEIFVFNNRVNFYPIFKDINYSFRELNVLSVALEYKKDIYSYYVYEDEILKGFIRINGIEIEKLYVDTFFQNEGIGGSLIEYAKENLGSKELWALEKNVKGIRFYQRHGQPLSPDHHTERKAYSARDPFQSRGQKHSHWRRYTVP